MGIEDRDWYRDEFRPRRQRRSPWPELIAAAIVGSVVVVALSANLRDRVAVHLPLRAASSDASHEIQIAPFPGARGVRLRAHNLYPPNDRWRAWLASEARCPGGEDAAAPARAQVRTMLCLVNYARRKQRLGPLELSSVLTSASSAKARDIARCGVFEHEACGKAAEQAARAAGYEGAWGENLFVATGPFVVPRVAVDRWLNSRGHRRNLFRPGWRTIGVARRAGADVGRIRNGVIWVNQFGA
jgi:Cysteine-rich secretory protein family